LHELHKNSKILIKKKIEVEHNLSSLYEQNLVGVFSKEERDRMKSLNSARNKFIERREVNWRIKSRVVWLDKGDEKKNCFHNFISTKRGSTQYGK
jgi:DNA gyrase/topoisomerase IV subunit B